MKHTFTQSGKRPNGVLQGLGILLALCLLTLPAFAQSRTVKGKVTAAKGDGLPGVSILVKGTSTGTTTNADGDYTISVADDKAVLVYSFIGFQSQQVTAGNQSIINLTLVEDTQQLGEVVVTALGIKKQERDLGYTTQTLGGDQTVKAREPNPINSLTGKIAGLTVAPSAELLGRPTTDSAGQQRPAVCGRWGAHQL